MADKFEIECMIHLKQLLQPRVLLPIPLVSSESMSS